MRLLITPLIHTLLAPQVFVRLRPPLQQDAEPCLHAADEHAVAIDAKPDQQQYAWNTRQGLHDGSALSINVYQYTMHCV